MPLEQVLLRRAPQRKVHVAAVEGAAVRLQARVRPVVVAEVAEGGDVRPATVAAHQPLTVDLLRGVGGAGGAGGSGADVVRFSRSG